MIPVTKPFFPPIEEYKNYIDQIWENQWLTNNGALVQELTKKIKHRFDANFFIPMANGTLPIQIALNFLANEGEVITTPFSYVVTTSAIVWEKCTPIFVDIHPEYLTIDETKIEAAITAKTTAILATHVYGNPCNVEEIDRIAKKHGLKVIYDAAHCFDVTYKGQSIFNYGDVSTCSFHATKLFHTAEGGGLFCQNEHLHHEMYYRHNCGHDGPLEFHGIGVNAKMNELQAAMGLSLFPYIDQIKLDRRRICILYDTLLNFEKVKKLKIREGTEWNYSYYPILFDTENDLINTELKLKESDIIPRRYFYPSLSNLPYVQNVEMKISDDISKRVLCLPLFFHLSEDDVIRIVNIINSNCL